MKCVDCPLFSVCPWGPLCTPKHKRQTWTEEASVASRGQPLVSVDRKPEPAFLWFSVGRR